MKAERRGRVVFVTPENEADRLSLERGRRAGKVDPGPENRRPEPIVNKRLHKQKERA